MGGLALLLCILLDDDEPACLWVFKFDFYMASVPGLPQAHRCQVGSVIV